MRVIHDGLTKNQRYRRNHPEKARAAVRDSHQRNPESYQRGTQRYRSSLKGRAQKIAAHAREVARVYDARSTLTGADVLMLIATSKGCCTYCGNTSDRMSLDHVRPFCRGGENTLQNVVRVCLSCNAHKHTGPPPCPVQLWLL